MRIEELRKIAKRRKLDEVVVSNEANLKALIGVACDNAILTLTAIYTDFRYATAIRRQILGLTVRDIKRFRLEGLRIGYESTISKAQYDRLVKLAPRGAKLVDIAGDLAKVRSVKTAEEIERIRAAEALNCDIWEAARDKFKVGMTEREMARLIKVMMIERGEGEAFETIVCIGKNAAECHHIPDDTVWNGREAILVDMGVKLGGVCSDLTRNVLPKRMSSTYRKVYELVQSAHDAAMAAARPGMTAAQLDLVARKMIKAGGFGKCFGHSLGHGVGYEIHEHPTVSSKSKKTVLKAGMVVTIEPGIYLEDNLGVRIEDMILITENGCERLSRP